MTFFLSQLTMDSVDHLRVTAKMEVAGCSECVQFEHYVHLSFQLDSKILYFSVFAANLLCVGFIVFLLDFYMHHKALGLSVIMLPLYTQMQSHTLVKK